MTKRKRREKKPMEYRTKEERQSEVKKIIIQLTQFVSTQHFFVRATNREFNYSNNPTYVNSLGKFAETSFETDPNTYISTIGLLNDANEMIAVAKTSQPIQKSFDKEVLIKVNI